MGSAQSNVHPLIYPENFQFDEPEEPKKIVPKVYNDKYKGLIEHMEYSDDDYKAYNNKLTNLREFISAINFMQKTLLCQHNVFTYNNCILCETLSCRYFSQNYNCEYFIRNYHDIDVAIIYPIPKVNYVYHDYGGATILIPMQQASRSEIIGHMNKIRPVINKIFRFFDLYEEMGIWDDIINSAHFAVNEYKKFYNNYDKYWEEMVLQSVETEYALHNIIKKVMLENKEPETIIYCEDKDEDDNEGDNEGDNSNEENEDKYEDSEKKENRDNGQPKEDENDEANDVSNIV